MTALADHRHDWHQHTHSITGERLLVCSFCGDEMDDPSCPDCGLPLADHLSADECEAHGIDAGLRDGLGCAVITRTVVLPSWGERGPQSQEEYDL